MTPTDATATLPVEDTVDRERRFGGIARLYGPSALAAFQRAHVAVIGIGGVGSWVAEALARSAVGTLTLIDLDNVAESNTNRQIHALDGNYGKAKVTAMAERIKLIDPACDVRQIEDFVEPGNFDATLGGGFDFVVDAIDSVRTKTALIAWCVARKQPLITVGGAGGQRSDAHPYRRSCAHHSGPAAFQSTRPVAQAARVSARTEGAFQGERGVFGRAAHLPRFAGVRHQRGRGASRNRFGLRRPGRSQLRGLRVERVRDREFRLRGCGVRAARTGESFLIEQTITARLRGGSGEACA